MSSISRQAIWGTALSAVSLMLVAPFALSLVAPGLAPGLAPLAAAQPAPSAADKTARADALFNQGLQQMEAGKFAEACQSFEQSQQIEGSASTVMNLANCREKNNQLATAAQLFTQAAEELRSNSSPEAASLRKTCLDRVAALQPRLSRLTLRVTAAEPSLELTRDDVVVPAAQWNQPLPLDGGRYTITAKAPGRTSWSEQIELAPEREQKTVEVPELAPVPTSEARLEVREPLPPPPPRRSLVLPISLGIGALALGGAAIGLDLNARSLNDEAQDPSSGPYAERNDKWESAKTRRYVAQGLGVAAVGAAGLAVYLYLRDRHDDSERPAKTAQAPRLSPLLERSPSGGGGVAGLVLDGRW